MICLPIALMLCAEPAFGQQPSAAMPRGRSPAIKRSSGTIPSNSLLDYRRSDAHVLVTVKSTSPRDGLRPPLTVPARGGQQSQVGHQEIVANWSNKEMEKIEDRLDNNCLMQGLGFENPESSQTGGDYCDRSLTAASAASFNPKTQENRDAHQAFWLSCKIGCLLTSNPADQFNRFRILHGRLMTLV